MATTESSLVPFDMALALYSGNPVPLNHFDPEHLFGGPAVYSEDIAYFGDPFLGGPFVLEGYSCSSASNAASPLPCYAPSPHGNYVLATDGLECVYPKKQRIGDPVQFLEFPLQPVEDPAATFLPFPDECCYYSGGCACENKKGGTGTKKQGAATAARPSLSAQSMAARVRRRKITEKTTELGRLIPGRRKMTTAEMLQAAHKYVRFLQAQVGLLQLIQSNDEVKEEVSRYRSGHIGPLLVSPRIQEKLYAEEKCLATKELVRSIMTKDEIRSREGMLRDLEAVINSC